MNNISVLFSDYVTFVGPCIFVCFCLPHGSLSRDSLLPRQLGPNAYLEYTSLHGPWNHLSSRTDGTFWLVEVHCKSSVCSSSQTLLQF